MDACSKALRCTHIKLQREREREITLKFSGDQSLLLKQNEYMYGCRAALSKSSVLLGISSCSVML